MSTEQAIDIPQGYKMTELGLLPEEWQVVRLGEVADYYYGKAKPQQNGQIPVVGSGGIYSFTNKPLINDPTIVIGRKGTAGKVWLLTEPCYPSDTTFYLKKKREFSLYFVFLYMLINPLSGEHAKTTLPSLQKTDLINFLIPLPPLPEQRAIAHILQTVQDAKEKIEGVIQAAKKLKKSLLKYLFTYGPVPVEDAEKVPLKKTEIGLVPEEWQVVRLGEVAEVIMGQSPPGSTYNQAGIGTPFLQGKAEFGNIFPSNIKYTVKPKKIAPEKSVLISVRAPVGDINIANIPYCIGRGLASLSMKIGDNIFLFYLLCHKKNDIEKEGTGSTFKAINKDKIISFPIPIPPIHIQQRIADILSTVDERIESAENQKQSLDILFKTLLSLLMSGKIRVNRSHGLVNEVEYEKG